MANWNSVGAPMKPAPFTYHRPTTVDEAVEILDAHQDAKVLAGGQSLLPLMALRLSQPDHIVDIGRLTELTTIAKRRGGLAVGSLVRHAAAEQSPLVAERAVLVHQAMPLIGHRAIRNRGTIGGSLAHADPAAELPAVVLAADAVLVARSRGGEREIAAADFFEHFLTTALAPGELLTEVRFSPPAPATHTTVVELARRHGDFALVGLASAVTMGDDDVVARAALAYFGVAPTPVRVAAAERRLVGSPLDDAAIDEATAIVRNALDPTGDNHASAQYRRHIASVLTTRALRDAAPEQRRSA
jgi:carbon-monoxide dehydrogenase medium subunit